jgi:hypothetical protein
MLPEIEPTYTKFALNTKHYTFEFKDKHCTFFEFNLGKVLFGWVLSVHDRGCLLDSDPLSRHKLYE